MTGEGSEYHTARPDEAVSHEEEDLRERYRELLEELRTINPGVQVLFAFLLTAPFSARFAELDAVGRNTFMVALLATTASALLFLAPASFHRIAPRTVRRERMRLAVRMALGGLSTLAVGMTAAVFLVTRFIYGSGQGVAVGASVAALAIALWFLLPLSRRLRGKDH